MDILKRAQENGETVVVVGATGPGKVTTVDSLGDLTAHSIIFGSTREGMGVGPVLSQVFDLVNKPKR